MEYKWTNPAVLKEKVFWVPFITKDATVVDESTGDMFKFFHGLKNDTAISQPVGAGGGALIASKGFKFELASAETNPLAITAITVGQSTTITLEDASHVSKGSFIKIWGAVETTNTDKTINGAEAQVTGVDEDKNEITLGLDTSSGYNTYAGGGYVDITDSCCTGCCSVEKTYKKMWKLTLGTSVVGTAGKESRLHLARELNVYNGYASWNGYPTVPETDATI